MVQTASQGRDIAVDGRETASDIGGVFAEELGLPPFAVTTEHASDRGRKAAWSADGWIDVCPLGPGSDFRYKLGIDLFHAPIPVERFAVLAERHRPTIAWCLDEAEPEDWRCHVAFPGGSAGSYVLSWDSFGDETMCRLSPPGPGGSGRVGT